MKSESLALLLMISLHANAATIQENSDRIGDLDGQFQLYKLDVEEQLNNLKNTVEALISNTSTNINNKLTSEVTIINNKLNSEINSIKSKIMVNTNGITTNSNNIIANSNRITGNSNRVTKEKQINSQIVAVCGYRDKISSTGRITYAKTIMDGRKETTSGTFSNSGGTYIVSTAGIYKISLSLWCSADNGIHEFYLVKDGVKIYETKMQIGYGASFTEVAIPGYREATIAANQGTTLAARYDFTDVDAGICSDIIFCVTLVKAN